jgi:hypothetical protein
MGVNRPRLSLPVARKNPIAGLKAHMANAAYKARKSTIPLD